MTPRFFSALLERYSAACSEVLAAPAIFPGCAAFTDVYMQVTRISMIQGLSPKELLLETFILKY